MYFWFGLAALPQAHAATAPSVMRDIPYRAGGKSDRRGSLDIYLPAKSVTKPPLLIFVHGGFWLLSDDEYRFGPSIAENLMRDGVAVALVRYRLAPAYRHPAQAEDVAAGVAYLIKNAEKYGFDGKRVYLAGHSAGGHLASLVALDRRFLEKQGLSPKVLAGVISISGLYDLAPTWNVSDNQKQATEKTFGHDPAVLMQASPMHHVSSQAPPFLILNAFQEFTGFVLDGHRFADALRRAGNKTVQQLMFKGADHLTIVKLDEENNPVRRTILSFMGVKAPPEPLADLLEASRRWSDPPYSTEPFWKYNQLVRSYPIDERFLQMLMFIYRDRKEELLQWPLERFYAIDLFAYLNALPKEQAGPGDFIVLNNIHGERQVWRRADVERYKPVIVIGIDDEKNLFRLRVFYRMFHEYSWKPGAAPPPLAMPLGGFIYFLEAPPRELTAQSWHFGLTADSFRRAPADPLKAIRDVPKEVEEALTFRNGCVYCHSFRGVGAQSRHVNALTGKPQGGVALPLESYLPEVWKFFMFDQENVAKKMGATPNIVGDSARQILFDLVNQSRRQQAAAPKK
ncbi:MAG TPA: alpha/beta hydrolase [Terriglobales bacterium]|nr:alpha/beta hydrolase [Terriglobales bacterium]